jgi:hypothetical protein
MSSNNFFYPNAHRVICVPRPCISCEQDGIVLSGGECDHTVVRRPTCHSHTGKKPMSLGHNTSGENQRLDEVVVDQEYGVRRSHSGVPRQASQH